MLEITDTQKRNFFRYVSKTETCWLWNGAVNRNDGYGRYGVGKPNRTRLAHRIAYQISGKEIPIGLCLDHLCRVRSCVNPAHLEPVTNHENISRGLKCQKEQCQRGHTFTPENTVLKNDGRECRTCRDTRRRRYYEASGK